MTDKKRLNFRADSAAIAMRHAQADLLGPNCEVSQKLRALYSSIQEETIPDHFLDLLEKLDQAEQESSRGQSEKSLR